MKIYTYQIGAATGADIHTLAHSETISAQDLLGAIEIAEDLTRTKYVATEANMVRLLEELPGDSRVVWFRSKDAVV